MSEVVWNKYSKEEFNDVMKFSDGYIDFLSDSKTERACVKNAIALAKSYGYRDIKEVIENKEILKAQDKVYVNMMNKSIALMHIGSNPLEKGMNILGAHIDSPRLDLKQNPLYEDGNIAYLDTHYYGGVKKYQWVTLPLAIHGVVCLKDGTTVDVAIGDKESDPVFVISDLLIHLSADQLQKKANEVIAGEDLNVTVGSIPLENEEKARPFFASVEEKAAFEKAHEKKKITWKKPQKGEVVRGYLGIDAGSTTTKFVLLSDNEEILDSFYAPNEGDPLKVAKQALIDLRERYKEAGAELEILSAGTTGYGEMLFSKAFDIKNHTVETVAHARAAEKYIQDASFILDIGGQDMKAIWLENGVITNILLNEACSSGCGSFLENFASSLHIPTKEIAKTAFSSKNPAVLGSRCTVFMNSGIITEQRNGRTSEDIMAGLCRSIIENVFTKVIRVSNLDSLGKKIVVQGGTFENDAVLRAMEEYVGRDVVRAPYPGIMGAIGMALIAKEKYEKSPETEEIWDLQNLDTFSYTQDANSPCPFCGNHCNRTIVKFSNGNSWVTNNRCERGEVIGNPKDKEVNRQVKEKLQKVNAVPNLYKIREELLFKDYPHNLSNTYKNEQAG